MSRPAARGPGLFPADPLADPKAVVAKGRCRFTVITDRLIRCEYAEDAAFEDRPSTTVINRRAPVPSFTVEQAGAGVVIRTARAVVTCTDCAAPFTADTLRAEFDVAAKAPRGTWKFGAKPEANLGGTARTLDGCDGSWKCGWVDNQLRPDLGAELTIEPGLLSRDGWAVVDDGRTVVLAPRAGADQPWATPRPAGERRDLYLFLHGRDYAAALRDGALLTGRQALPPRWAFGYWFCRYWAYTDRELAELVAQHDAAGVPLDTVVIDMDWHQLGWTGYSWAKELFPDPAETLGHLHAQGIKVSLNLHPADGVSTGEDRYAQFRKAMGEKKAKQVQKPDGRIPFDCTDPDYMRAYFQVLHHPLEQQGVDVWWMDWQQGEQTAIAGLDPLTWLNHLHWQDQARRGDDRRPMIFTRYGGLGSGRRPIGFSGDTTATWKSLAYQPSFTARSANLVFGQWSHDIGGHFSAPEPELYARWIQWGMLSPILRTHCTKNLANDRRISGYPEPYRSAMVAAVQRRYELVPYMASEWRSLIESGESLLRPMYHECPELDDAYRCNDQYRFGSRMIAAPVIAPADPADEQARQRVWLPPGAWIAAATGTRLSGGWHEIRSLLGEVPTFVRPGTVIPGQCGARRLLPGSYRHLLVDVWAGGEDTYRLIEDDGVSQGYTRGEEAAIALSHREDGARRRITVHRAEGSFTGFLRRRPLRLRVHLAAPPKQVRLGRQILEWSLRPAPGCWSYDGDTATTIIDLPEVDLGADTTIDITHLPLPAKALDGLPGLMTRLRRAMAITLEISYYFPVHKDERLCAQLGQTGNRIQRDPRRIADELAELRRSLPRLRTVLAEHQDGLATMAAVGHRATATRMAVARRIVDSAL